MVDANRQSKQRIILWMVAPWLWMSASPLRTGPTVTFPRARCCTTNLVPAMTVIKATPEAEGFIWSHANRMNENQPILEHMYCQIYGSKKNFATALNDTEQLMKSS